MMSGGFRVSDSTIETAARAAFAHDYRVMGREWIADRPPERYHQEMVRKAIEAVLPSLVAEIREQASNDIIEAFCCAESTDETPRRHARNCYDLGCDAARDAARVARGDAG